MNNNNYFTKRAVCFKRGLDYINYGQTGVVQTDASTGEDHCWFIADGVLTNPSAIKLEIQNVFFDDIGYTNGTEI